MAAWHRSLSMVMHHSTPTQSGVSAHPWNVCPIHFHTFAQLQGGLSCAASSRGTTCISPARIGPRSTSSTCGTALMVPTRKSSCWRGPALLMVWRSHCPCAALVRTSNEAMTDELSWFPWMSIPVTWSYGTAESVAHMSFSLPSRCASTVWCILRAWRERPLISIRMVTTSIRDAPRGLPCGPHDCTGPALIWPFRTSDMCGMSATESAIVLVRGARAGAAIAARIMWRISITFESSAMMPTRRTGPRRSLTVNAEASTSHSRMRLYMACCITSDFRARSPHTPSELSPLIFIANLTPSMCISRSG
mmetsp:Transcript_91916/g.260180  ORF Transcript_91916/g.260180 Transcript_91916/m.260180 type:complete len:306 (+) Transcript_91916:729-1646(+)